jgi:hypothetical protein
MTPPPDLRNCCHDETCPRIEWSHAFEPDDPIEARVEVAADKIAATCGRLSDEQLRSCFGRIFELTPECRLYDRFRNAYQVRDGETTAP